MRQSVVKWESPDLLSSVCPDEAVLVLIPLLVIVEEGSCVTQAVESEAERDDHDCCLSTDCLPHYTV